MHFFREAAEDRWIAPFEAHHVFAAARRTHQLLIDFTLLPNSVAPMSAEADEFRSGARMAQDRRVDQIVVEHAISDPQALDAAPRNQAGVARPCADQKHLSLLRRAA